jgi:hypothetical protein
MCYWPITDLLQLVYSQQLKSTTNIYLISNANNHSFDLCIIFKNPNLIFNNVEYQMLQSRRIEARTQTLGFINQYYLTTYRHIC